MMTGGGAMSNNWTSIKKNLRKKSTSAWSLKIKNPPAHGKGGGGVGVDPTTQLAAALAGISTGNRPRSAPLIALRICFSPVRSVGQPAGNARFC